MPSQQTGINFTNLLYPGPEAANQNLLNGSGVALGDYDNDGRCDIFLCNLNGSSKLYRYLGNWKFQDTTDAAGLGNTNMLARGAVFADPNGDGRLDLLVTYSGKGAVLFLNAGGGNFTNAQASELSGETGSMSMGLGDVNGDGWLDLYVANYGENTIRSGMKISTRMVGGKEQVVGRYRNRLRIIEGNLVEYGEPDAFYLNDGKGRFRKMSWTDGTFRDEAGAPIKEAPWELGFTVVIRDINQDGYPDIYVCNDFQDPDRFWLGDGKGGFRAPPREALRSIPNFSMTADFADIDGDGHDDFIVTDMLSRYHALRMRELKPASPTPLLTREMAWDRPQIRRNFLFLNRGDGTYADIANFAGVANSDWSWSVAFIDVEFDGRPDILIGTGHYYDTQDLDAIEKSKTVSQVGRADSRQVLSLFPLLLTPNVAFHNRGDLTFDERARTWGFDSVQVSHSIALSDLDNDGDLDVVVNCLRAAALIYRNNCPAPRVAVRLKGLPPNTSGIGSRITLRGGAVPSQTHEMTGGSRFLAGDAYERVFAAGSAGNDMTLEVTWRSGKRSTVQNVRPNRRYEVSEMGAVTVVPEKKAHAQKPQFEDVTASLNHRHVESQFDDFSRQPLLPRRLSQLGPGVTFADLNGDARDDIVVGGAKENSLGVFLNLGSGKWQQAAGAFTNALADDSSGLLIVPLQPGSRSLLAGSAQLENIEPNGTSVLRYEVSSNGVVAAPPLPGMGVSTGPLCVADVEADGELELFVGGHFRPGHYPEPAASRLYTFKGGGFVHRKELDALLASSGLVSAAVFTDLEADGFPELVFASEWGPLRILRNHAGRLAPWDFPLEGTAALGIAASASKLSELHGLWTAVAAGDFDADGRMDLVLGNWGLNSPFQQGTPGPWFLYYGDLNDDGTTQIVEGYREPGGNRILPWRDLLLMEKGLPWLRARFPSHLAWSEADVPRILGEKSGKTQSVRAELLSSMLLMNRGDKFVPRLLPREAQWSPVMGIVVGDFNGDAQEDLFLSQNYFATRSDDGRMDAGRGLLLIGGGQGEFSPVPGQESGLKIYGEQRGCAAADYDQDGRLDLVVTQNNEQTRLFHNRLAKPGIRVRVAGPEGNPDGIGAVLRMETGGGRGPVREIVAGSGFWSQNSPIQVLASPGPDATLSVRWPGGKTTRSKIPAGVKAVVVDAAGMLRVEN
jgi:hypothetical protein